MRTQIWDYLHNNYRCLIAVAEEIAIGVDPHTSHGGIALSGLMNKACPNCGDKRCPQPINYLANCASPSVYKSWQPSGSFKFNPCDFHALRPLAMVKGAPGFIPKTNADFCGFNTGGTQGLSILLGPWSDYCLWCWSQYPQHYKNTKPILILGKDNDTFAAQTICAGQDWGVEQVNDTAKIGKAADISTQRLFGAIEEQAAMSNMTVSEFIAAKRIFIYNIWPWFRCGNKSTGDDGIHSNFCRVPCLWHWLNMLIKCLNPHKIASLGGWSWDDALHAPDALMRSMLPTAFPGAIEVFRHPSSRNPNGWFDPWENPPAWGMGDRWGGKNNNEEFKDFVGTMSIAPLDVLDDPVDE
ncbi:MAG: hypothetical protein WCS94_10830 [Verrucomicrobiota bacterium]